MPNGLKSCVTDKRVPALTRVRGQMVVILLAGGDKRTQARDIKTAIDLARKL
jgi:putative component of toxin-antitoxin plasmid stabilization module